MNDRIFSDPLEAVVIGAGAAGVGAGRVLQAAGASWILIEARDRLGGRAHTISHANFPDRAKNLDMGAQWLHSADKNPLVPLARTLKWAIDDCEPQWGRHAGPGMSLTEARDFREQSQKFWRALEQAAEGPDRAAAELLTPGGRWNPILQAISCYYSGAELEKVSIRDLGRYEETGINWSLFEGFGAFIAAAGADLPAIMNCQVQKIDHGARLLAIETTLGTVRAKAAIITISSDLLAKEKIVFAPKLPDKLAAAAQTPLGLANKIFFSVPAEDCENLPIGGHAFGALDRPEIISFDLRPRAAPLVAGFVGGDFAKFLETEPGAFEAEARAQFSALFGAGPAKRLKFLANSAWGRDPFALGSYSYGKVGVGGAREILAAPVDNRLFFAGEACSIHRFSTVHGAFETGERAARQALAALQKADVII